MSIKAQAHDIIDQLDDNATWDDVVKSLYKNKKITLGMSDIEIVQPELSDSDVNTIMARLKASSHQPSDMRNTKTYDPGNAVTLGMIAGIAAILFSFVFPPIAWVAAVLALGSGVFGVAKKEDKAWVPILMAVVSLVPVLSIL